MNQTKNLKHNFGLELHPHGEIGVFETSIVAIKSGGLKTNCPLHNIYTLEQHRLITTDDIKNDNKNRCFSGLTYCGYSLAFNKHLIQPTYSDISEKNEDSTSGELIYSLDGSQILYLVNSWIQEAHKQKDDAMLRQAHQTYEEINDTPLFLNICGGTDTPSLN